MSKEICTICAGSGEGMILTSSDPDSAAYELGDCWACRGTGFRLAVRIRKSGEPSSRVATDAAVSVMRSLLSGEDR